MRRPDDVFFFTLIDFLLQVFFFGLLIFVANQAAQANRERKGISEHAEIEKLKNAMRVSNITELTDELTKMAPLSELRGTSDFIQRNGGRKNVEAAVSAANSAGGVAKISGLAATVKAQNERLEKLEGWGKVSCLSNEVVKGKLQPKSITTITVLDKLIRVEDATVDFHSLLREYKLNFESVRQLSPTEFRSTFAPIVEKQPECRYFLRANIQTQFIEPLRAVWSAFRTI